MRTVFADTGFFIALLDRKDSLHPKALAAIKLFKAAHIFTSQLVLTELLNYFSAAAPAEKTFILTYVTQITEDPLVTVVPLSQSLYKSAKGLYQKRLDKAWSLTDCSSFQIMESKQIQHALAFDKHFEQAGFVALLR